MMSRTTNSLTAGQKNSSSFAYRPDIDGLRGVAILSVVISHAFPEILSGGFIGVDIFFVISGYLISTIIIKSIREEYFSVISFYKRRIIRIFPALITILFCALIAGWFSLFSDEFKQVGKHAAGGAAFIANIILWKDINYFDNAAQLKPLLHLWSLGIEEQFYIIFPFLLLLSKKLNISFFKAALVIYICSFALSLYYTFYNKPAAFYSPISRGWELATGVIVSCLSTQNNKFSLKLKNIQAFCGISLICIGLFLINEKSKFPGIIVLLPVTGAALFIFAGADAWINKVIISNKFFVWIGLVSYPLYLWHWPILSWMRIGISDGSYRDILIFEKIIALVSAFILSILTYKYIEKPIRFGGKKNMWSMILLVIMFFIAVSGWLIFLNNGFPKRIKLVPPSASILFNKYPHPLKTDCCGQIYPDFKDSWSCLLSKPEQADIALIGDSHAMMYYQSLDKKMSNHNILNISHPPCLPFSAHSDGGYCEWMVKKTAKFLQKNESIKTVIITGYFSYLMSGFKYGNIEGRRVANNVSRKDKALFSDSAIKFLSNLTSKNIIVFMDIPDLIFKPRSCVQFQNYFMEIMRGGIKRRTINNCGIFISDFQKRNDSHDKILLSVLSNFSNIKIFSPRKLFRQGDMYVAYKNGHFLYWNSDHLTCEGTDMVIDAFLESSIGKKLMQN